VLSEVLVLLGSIGRSHLVADAIGLNCGIWKASEDNSKKSIGSRSLEGQVHGVD